MKLKITQESAVRDLTRGSMVAKEGDEVNVAAEEGKSLIKIGRAVEVKGDLKPEKEKVSA